MCIVPAPPYILLTNILPLSTDYSDTSAPYVVHKLRISRPSISPEVSEASSYGYEIINLNKIRFK